VGKKVAGVIQEILDAYQGSYKSSRGRREARENDLLSNIHLIGHSLGAHVMGHAGKVMAAQKVGRISGADFRYLVLILNCYW